MSVAGFSDSSEVIVATPHRRKLRFETIDDALADAERLVAAERADRLARAGNWTLGQALGHLATWANFAFDGYPPEIRPPLPIRMMLRALRKKFLNTGMPAGVRIANAPEGTLGVEVLPTDEGLARYRAAVERLRRTPPTLENPAFGKLTHEEWIRLNLRHAELHLSFQVPG